MEPAEKGERQSAKKIKERQNYTILGFNLILLLFFLNDPLFYKAILI